MSVVAKTLSEDETAGPLVYPLSLVASPHGLWVLDAGAQRVLLLADGKPPVVLGRKGGGPGEFKNPVSLHPVSADRVLVWDPAQLRVTEWSVGDPRPRTQLVSPFLQGLNLKNALPARGGLLAVFDKSADALNAPSGSQGSAGVLARLRYDSEAVDTLATFPLSGPVILRESKGSGFTMTALSPPFDAVPHSDATQACGGLSVVSVGGRGFELDFFGPDGGRLGKLRQDIVGAEISPAERERYFEQFGEELHRRLDLRKLIRIPERHPAIHAVRLTSSGHLWVRLSAPTAEMDATARWRVWPLTAVPNQPVRPGEATDVLLPSRFSIQDVQGERVWGFFYDEMDAAHVRAYLLPQALPRGCETG